jgi:hypothetical protein
MSSFFQSLAEVNVANKFYKGVAIVSICAAALVCVLCFAYANKAIESERNKIYTLDGEGNVMTMSRSTVAEKRPVEAVAHARLLLMYLFDIDRFTYKERLDKAYNLGNNCIYAVYKEQEAGGWYLDVEQYNARSTLLIHSLTCESSSPPYVVAVDFSVVINSDITKNKRYALTWELVMEEGTVERTEQNPHNLMVTQVRKKKFEEVIPQ